MIASVVEMELDCEKRSIAKIQENELPIDLEEYIKEANEYLLSYAICIKTGKWDDCTEPLNAEVREAMPDQLLELKDYIDLDNPLLDIIMNPKHIDPKVFKDQIEDVKKNGPESEEESQTITNASNINDPNEDPITYKIVNGKKVLVGGFHRVRKALEGNLKEIPAKEVA